MRYSLQKFRDKYGTSLDAMSAEERWAAKGDRYRDELPPAIVEKAEQSELPEAGSSVLRRRVPGCEQDDALPGTEIIGKGLRNVIKRVFRRIVNKRCAGMKLLVKII